VALPDAEGLGRARRGGCFVQPGTPRVRPRPQRLVPLAADRVVLVALRIDHGPVDAECVLVKPASAPGMRKEWCLLLSRTLFKKVQALGSDEKRPKDPL
jgi:hypothetical protein